jgi:phosphate uptake regulator
MDTRKLQATGGASLSVTLPKKWLEKEKLEDKDILIMNEQKDGSLIIRNKKTSHFRKVTLRVNEGNNNNLNRLLNSIYKIGIEQLTLKLEDNVHENKAKIRKATGKLMGWEIIEESANEMVVSYLLDTSKIPVGQTIKKLFSLTNQMLIDLSETITTENLELSKDIIERDDEVDKLCMVINRSYYSVLSGRNTEEEIGYSAINLSYFREIGKNLERICDQVVKIENVLLISKKFGNESEKLKIVLDDLVGILSEAEKLVITEEIPEANELSFRLSEIKKKTLFNKGMEDNTVTDVILHDSLNRIRGYINNIVEAMIDQIVIKIYR